MSAIQIPFARVICNFQMSIVKRTCRYVAYYFLGSAVKPIPEILSPTTDFLLAHLSPMHSQQLLVVAIIICLQLLMLT